MGNLFSLTPPSRPMGARPAGSRGLVDLHYLYLRYGEDSGARAAAAAPIFALPAAPGSPSPDAPAAPGSPSPGAPAAPFLTYLVDSGSPGAASAPFLAYPIDAGAPGAPAAPFFGAAPGSPSPGAPAAPFLTYLVDFGAPGAASAPFLAYPIEAGAPGAPAAPFFGAFLGVPAAPGLGAAPFLGIFLGIPGAPGLGAAPFLGIFLGIPAASGLGAAPFLGLFSGIPPAHTDCPRISDVAGDACEDLDDLGATWTYSKGSRMGKRARVEAASGEEASGYQDGPGDASGERKASAAAGSIGRGRNRSNKMAKLSGVPYDVLHRIALIFQKRGELVRTMFTSQSIYKSLASQEFSQAYRAKRHSSPACLIAMFDRREVEAVALTLDDPMPISFDFLKERHRWEIVECRGGLSLLEDRFGGGGFLVCDPLKMTSKAVAAPPAPLLQTLLAAGVVPEEEKHWSVVVLFACPLSSSQGRFSCWTGFYSSEEGVWHGNDQRVNFLLPYSRMQVEGPSIQSGRTWNVMAFNQSILSVNLDNGQLVQHSLPFELSIHSIRPIRPHLLGRNRDGDLCLIEKDGEGLSVWKYDKAGTSLYKRYPRFAHCVFSGFAEENCMLILQDWTCFNIDEGLLLLPFAVRQGQAAASTVPYEMAWPPRPPKSTRPS